MQKAVWVVVREAIRLENGRWGLFDHRVQKYVAFGHRRGIKTCEYGYWWQAVGVAA